MGCIRTLLRLLVIGALVVVALILFLPHFLAQAGSSLINPINGNAPSISGLAQFIPASFISKDNTLQITVGGLTANAKYDVTLDPNACGSNNYVDVGIITADTNGNVSTNFKLAPLNLNENWFVDIHNGANAGDAVLGCGQLNLNNSSATIEASNTTLQLSPTAVDLNSGQMTTVSGVTPTAPHNLPNTGVAPGGANSYDNNVYPRKF
ncbi:MAG TPA: hypothetical protein VKR83_17415 [Ktedonobacteraceae bacterium]|nr:hypothetical protein [Ktedonobacteraceae bacterium]